MEQLHGRQLTHQNMRSLLLRIKSQDELPQDTVQDISTQKFSNVFYISLSQLLVEGDPNVTSMFKQEPSQAMQTRLERKLLIQKLSQLDIQIHDKLPCVNLPIRCAIVMLHGFGEWIQYSGQIILNKASEKPASDVPTDSNELNINVFYNEPQDVSDPKAKKNTGAEPLQFILNEQPVEQPILQAIVQQICVEFMQREIFIHMLKGSNVWNLSGQSINLCIYPTVHTMPHDQQLLSLYDTNSSLQQLKVNYNNLLSQCKEDDNKIPVILGAMIDSVILQESRVSVPKTQYTQQILLPERQLIYSIQSQQQVLQTPASYNYTCSVNTLDTFTYSGIQYQSALGKVYFERYVKALLLHVQTYLEIFENQIDLITQKAQFSELVRMFMNQLCQDISIAEAEDIIRKTILLHLQKKPDSFCIDITEPLTNNEINNFDIQKHQIVKLGSMENQDMNILSVYAQALCSHDMPTKNSYSYDPMTATYVITQELEDSVDNVVQQQYKDEDQLKFTLEAELNHIAKALGIKQKYSPFQHYVPNYAQFSSILSQNLKVVKQGDGGQSLQKGGKSARGAPEITTEIKLAFDNDFRPADVTAIFQPANPDPKKAKGSAPSILNPFIPVVENDWLKALHCAVHQKLFTEPENEPGQAEEEGKDAEKGSENDENKEETENKDLDQPSVSVSTTILDGQMFQTNEDLVSRYESGIYYSARTLLGNGETSLKNMLGKFTAFKCQLPTVKEGQQQADPKAAKDKKAPEEPGILPDYNNLIDVDSHLGVACFLAQQQGDERNVYIFNRILQIIYGRENACEEKKNKYHCELCAKQAQEQEQSEAEKKAAEEQKLEGDAKSEGQEKEEEKHQKDINLKYFDREKQLIFCMPEGSAGATGDGVEFIGKRFELKLKDLLAKINEKQAALNQIEIYKQSNFKGAKYENLTEEYKIGQTREYGDYYVHVSDKAVIKALPINRQLRLTRQFCGLSNSIPGLTQNQLFCDSLILNEYSETIDEPISTRPMSANTAAQKGGKGAKPEDLVETHVPQKLLDLSLRRMALSEADNLNLKYPSKGKLTGTFQDGWQVRAAEEVLVLSNDYVNTIFDLTEQSFELCGEKCHFKFFNGQADISYDNQNFSLEIIEKKQPEKAVDAEEIPKLTEPTGDIQEDAQEKKDEANEIEIPAEEAEILLKEKVQEADKKQTAENIPNFYSAIATLVENKLLVLTDFHGLEVSHVEEEVAKEVVVKCDIDDIKCYGNQLNVISFSAILLPFSPELREYVAIEFGCVSTVLICDRQKSCILIVHGLGDLFYTNLSDKYVQILKQDGTTLQFFTVEAKGATYNDFSIKFQQQNQQEDVAASKAPTKKGKEEPVVQEEPPKKQIYRSPIILYAGSGYVFWNSIVEKKSRYNRHNTVGSRVNFDLERKLNPTLCNPESRKSFDMQDVFDAMNVQKDEAIKAYSELMTFGPESFKKAKEDFNLQRLHHEMFIPMSDTEISSLQGVYRIVLGETNAIDTPLYPSISIYDWSGNTTHLRLGASLEHKMTVQVYEQATPDPAAKKGAPEQVLVQKTLFAPDTAYPVLPPVDSASVQSDVTSQIENLIAERQATAEAFAEKLRTFKLNKEAAKDQPPSPDKGVKGGKPVKGKAEQLEEPESEPTIEQITTRNIQEILSELKDIEVQTPYQQLILRLAGDQKAQIAKRQEKPILDNAQLTEFIHEKINAQMPSPARRAFAKKTILFPASPTTENVNQRFKSLIEADIPWAVIEVEDLKWIEYISQLHGFADTPSLKLNLTPETFNLRFYAPFQAYGCPSVPKFTVQLQAVMQQIVKQTLKASCGYLHVLKACSPIFKIQQTEYQSPEPEQYFFNQYINIYNYANPNIIEVWNGYEQVKEVYREILSKRHQKIAEPKVVSAKRLLSNAELLKEVEDYVANVKILHQKEQERHLQRQKEIELEKQLHEQKLLQKEKMKQQQSSLTTEDYSIDKPLGKKNANKQNSSSKSQLIKPKQLSIQYDEIDSEDEDLDTTMLKSQRYVKKFPVLSGIEKQALPKVLPLFKTQKGQAHNMLIKVLPDRLNGRVEKNVVIIKSLSKEPIQVQLQYDDQYVELPQLQFQMGGYEQKRVFVKHIRFGDSDILITAKQGQQEMQAVVKIMQ